MGRGPWRTGVASFAPIVRYRLRRVGDFTCVRVCASVLSRGPSHAFQSLEFCQRGFCAGRTASGRRRPTCRRSALRPPWIVGSAPPGRSGGGRGPVLGAPDQQLRVRRGIAQGRGHRLLSGQGLSRGGVRGRSGPGQRVPRAILAPDRRGPAAHCGGRDRAARLAAEDHLLQEPSPFRLGHH